MQNQRQTFTHACLIAFLLAMSDATSVAAQSGDQKYVRAGAVGTGTGVDWDNAYPTLPTALARETIYYIAAGSYGAYVASPPVNGTSSVTVRKATSGDHGTDVGWKEEYGAGAGTFPGFKIGSTAYMTIDGLTISGLVGVLPVDGYGLPSDSHHITLKNITAEGLFIAAEDINVIGGSFGGFDACDPAKGEDAVEIWELGDSAGNYRGSSRVTLDGVTVHDITDHNNTCMDAPDEAKGRHVDCVQILSGHSITIRNSLFYNCATSDVVAQGFRDTLSDLRIENNFMQDVQHPGAVLNLAGGSGEISGVNIVQYNTIVGSAQFVFPVGGSVIVRGNILTVGSCDQGVYSHNVFLPDSDTCGDAFVQGLPAFVGPTPLPQFLNGIVPNYRLARTDTIAVDAGDPAAYPPTDIDGHQRYQGQAPDAGAYERPALPSAPTNLRIIVE